MTPSCGIADCDDDAGRDAMDARPHRWQRVAPVDAIRRCLKRPFQRGLSEEPARDFDDYARSPVGRYLVGAHWAHFWPLPELHGVMMWGRPSEQDVTQVLLAVPNQVCRQV